MDVAQTSSTQILRCRVEQLVDVGVVGSGPYPEFVVMDDAVLRGIACGRLL